MEMGIIGLGKMGSGLALQALSQNIKVCGYTLRPKEDLKKSGLQITDTLEDFVQALKRPRCIFLYVPAGSAVEETLSNLCGLLDDGDIIVDGGNSYWGDSIRRSRDLAQYGIHLLDAGTSGGVSGAREGACFMIGGNREAYDKVAPLFEKLSVADGFAYVGPSGSGHLVKLIHNGIEFGMLQAIGEGMALLEKFREQIPFDMEAIFKTYRNGSVIRSWLIDLMAQQYQENGGVMNVPSYIEDTGEVNWLVSDALHLEVPIPVISQSVIELFRSRDKTGIDHRAIALMRHGFGGHPFGPKKELQKERITSRVDQSFPEIRIQ